MADKIILMPVHGFGNAQENFDNELIDKLKSKSYLGDRFNDVVHVEKIHYEPIFQSHSSQVLDRIKKKAGSDFLRNFLITHFSDAAALEHHSDRKNSPYHRTQELIIKRLRNAKKLSGKDAPIIVLAQSLGGQLISNYIWDAQNSKPDCGIFYHNNKLRIDTKKQYEFEKFKTLRHFITTGCNIPVFVSGFKPNNIKPIALNSNGYNFSWDNYFDKDDSLGFPLAVVSKSYSQSGLIDHKINALGSGLFDFFKSFIAFSHDNYWRDDVVLRMLTKKINALIPDLSV